MACQLRALWVFHMESEVRLLTSRRFPTVERKLQRLQGDSHVPLPCDEDISHIFVSEVLEEQEDHSLPPDLPEPFHEDFRQGSFSWDPAEESRMEKLWPMGPMTALMKGRIWPVVFLHKKGYYLVAAVAIMDGKCRGRLDSGNDGTGEARPRALDLPQVTAAFAVLEDICDFIPANLSISDVAGISELQYYIRSALPFGSPVNTNFHLLRMVRHGFPNKEDDTSQRSPAWKPYLYKGKPKLTLSVVETVNCTLYGKSEYEDECFIQGTVYCCADIAGVPEVCVPISFQPTAPGGDDSSQEHYSSIPEISVHNCAHIIGGIKSAKEDSLKISCLPPTGPFVLCRYNFRQSPITPVRGFYQLKELSPVEFRLLLQVQLHPQVLSASSGSWNCQVRLPFDHRGVIRSHDLKCTSGSFSLADHSRSIVWNLNVRRPRGSLEANLLGELIFEAPQKPHEQQIKRDQQPLQQKPAPNPQPQQPQQAPSQPPSQPAPSPQAETVPEDSPAPTAQPEEPPSGEELEAPETGVSPEGDVFASRSGVDMLLNAAGGGAHAGRDGLSSAQAIDLEQDMLDSALPGIGSDDRHGESPGAAQQGPVPSAAHHLLRGGHDGEEDQVDLAATSLVIAAVGAPARAALTPVGNSTQGAATTVTTTSVPSTTAVQAVQDVALSGVNIDPKAVTVYPTTRVYGGVAVQKEFLTGKYIIWNMAGEVRGHYNGLEFDSLKGDVNERHSAQRCLEAKVPPNG
ncbi:unnamed protein product [Durusdinium trenchii]|uniref:MHD domain-containing protein n=1 Tax=Durusdinium trenchii TaxID=1381693 RepID=A0ABP0SV83_9DINO